MTNSEWSWQLSDHMEGLSWDKLAGGKPFVFIQVGVALTVMVHLGIMLCQCLHLVLPWNLSHVELHHFLFNCFISC